MQRADSAGASSGGALPLFFQRRFLPMWVAVSMGAFADNILRQALLIGIPYGVISAPGFQDSDNAIPLIGALLPLAILIFTSISGQLADKYETSMMFRRTKAVEIGLMMIAAAAFATGNGLAAILMLFAMGAQSAFFSPVRVGAMPKYLRPEELVRGNAICNAGLFGFILMGYVVGGYLIARPNGGIIVGATLLTASMTGFYAATRTPFAAANAPNLALDFNGFRQTRRLFDIVMASRGVAPPLLGVGAFYLMATTVTVITPLYARDSLNADPLVATLLNGLFAVGAGLGAIGAASLAKGRSALGFSAASVAAAGVLSIIVFILSPIAAPDAERLTAAALFSSPTGIALALAFVATAALMGIYIAPLQAAMQRRAPAPVRARIMAASAFMNAAFAIPGSLAIFAVTGAGADPALAFLGVAAAMLFIAAVMLRRYRSLPPGLFEEGLSATPSMIQRSPCGPL